MPSWKRNLSVVWAAELVAIAGFSVVFPFLPYYIQELGVTDVKQVTLWSGIILASQAVTMAVFAPIWGAVADRYGRKLMLERALFGGAVVLVAMGLVRNVQQLALLRALQGVLTGTVTAAMALVASSTPRDRSGYAMGLLQMAIWIGASVGPLLGGVVADAWGYRAAFWITGTLLFVGGLTVWRFVVEDFHPPERREGGVEAGFWHGLRVVARNRGLLSLYGIGLVGRSANSLLTPLLPLFIQSLVPGSSRIASLTGLISGVAAGASAVGALTIGRSSDRVGYRRVLLLCMAGAAVTYIPMSFVASPWQLMALQAMLGLTLSGMLASLTALLANLAPEGLEGAVYGVDASVTAVSSAIGPMVGAGIAAVAGLRVPFLIAGGAFGLACVLAWFAVPRKTRKQDLTPTA